MPKLTTSRYTLTDTAEPPGLRVEERKAARVALLNAQEAADLLTQADRLASVGGLSNASADKALNWLIESYL